MGVFLYYAIAIDNTVLVALSNIGSEQTRATSKTMDEVQQLLDYLTSNPNAIIQYHASGMILSSIVMLHISWSQKQGVEPVGVFFLSYPKPDSITFSEYTPILNGFIFIMCKILRNIMASAAEVEYGALFLNGQASAPIRTTFIEMHHPQPPTPIQVENSTAVGISSKSIKQKHSKAMDMHFN